MMKAGRNPMRWGELDITFSPFLKPPDKLTVSILQYIIFLQTKDAAFEDYEKRFNGLKESVQTFFTGTLPFREQLHDTIMCQYNISQNVADLYTSKIHTREVERFKTAHKKIISTFWNEFVRTYMIYS